MSSARDPRVRLGHVLEHIDGLLGEIDGLTFDEVRTSFLHTKAIERCIRIVSEAAKELPDDLEARRSDVNWCAIAGVGNLLRHEYYRVDPHLMWEIATVHLPLLRDVAVAMLSELDDRP